MTVPPVARTSGAAPVERGWGKLLFALAAFLLLPQLPQMRAFLPIERTTMLLVPALAACAVVGWWAGGRAVIALVTVGLAVLLAVVPMPHAQVASDATAATTATVNALPVPDPFWNLARGWCLLLAGAFGLVCLFGARRPFFPRALVALSITLMLALVMSTLGPVSASEAVRTLSDEFARRNASFMAFLNATLDANAVQWQDLVKQAPMLAASPAQVEAGLRVISGLGLAVFPALLSLESLAGLALAWALYHRLSRARLGAPLGPLREFRFNDQLVWGLIVGLTTIFLPTLSAFRGVGRNLLVFFGALYALRGLAVLTWFMSPRVLITAVIAIPFMLLVPPLAVAGIALVMLVSIAAFGLGLGDTWADWRRRARITP